MLSPSSYGTSLGRSSRVRWTAIGTGDAFSKGRDSGAWLGLVPKQISTGDRTILGGISKRGNRYLRALFVQAAACHPQHRTNGQRGRSGETCADGGSHQRRIRKKSAVRFFQLFRGLGGRAA